jgi:hypothetical protein
MYWVQIVLYSGLYWMWITQRWSRSLLVAELEPQLSGGGLNGILGRLDIIDALGTTIHCEGVELCRLVGRLVWLMSRERAESLLNCRNSANSAKRSTMRSLV